MPLPPDAIPIGQLAKKGKLPFDAVPIQPQQLQQLRATPQAQALQNPLTQGMLGYMEANPLARFATRHLVPGGEQFTNILADPRFQQTTQAKGLGSQVSRQVGGAIPTVALAAPFMSGAGTLLKGAKFLPQALRGATAAGSLGFGAFEGTKAGIEGRPIMPAAGQGALAGGLMGIGGNIGRTLMPRALPYAEKLGTAAGMGGVNALLAQPGQKLAGGIVGTGLGLLGGGHQTEEGVPSVAQRTLRGAISFLTQKVPPEAVQSTLDAYNRGMRVLDPKWMSDFVTLSEKQFKPVNDTILNPNNKVDRSVVLTNLSKVRTGKRGQELPPIVDPLGQLNPQWELNVAGMPEGQKTVIKNLVSKLTGIKEGKKINVGGVEMTPDQVRELVAKTGNQNIDMLRSAGILPSEKVTLKTVEEVRRTAGQKFADLPETEGLKPHSAFSRSLAAIFAAADDSIAQQFPQVSKGIKAYAEASNLRRLPEHFQGGHLSFFRVIFPRIALMGLGLPAAAASMIGNPKPS